MMKVFSKIILVLGAIFLIIRIFFKNIPRIDNKLLLQNNCIIYK